MEKLTFVRWILFIVILIQALKLFALSGISWAQAWGCLFLASFAIVGVVILLGYAYDRSQTSNSSQYPRRMDSIGTRHVSDLSSTLEHSILHMEKVDGACAALGRHIAILPPLMGHLANLHVSNIRVH